MTRSVCERELYRGLNECSLFSNFSLFLFVCCIFDLFGVPWVTKKPVSKLESMVAPNPKVYDTRRHGVKVVSAISVDECSVAICNIVGHECVQAASRMNNTIVLFLSTIEKANEVEL